MVEYKQSVEKAKCSAGLLLLEVEILFQRIDKKVIETKTEKLKHVLGQSF